MGGQNRPMKIKVLLVGLVLSGNVFALEYSVGGELAYESIEVGKESFSPIVFETNAAVRHKSGWGAELRLGTGVKDASANSLEISVASRAAALVTFTPDIEELSARVTLGAGYVSTELDSSLNNTGFPGKQSYDGAVVQLTLEEQMGYKSNFYWYGGFRSYYRDDDVTMNSLGFGVRYGF